MELNTFLEKHPEYESEKYKVEAMLLGNASEDFVLKHVSPVRGAIPINFTCPNCERQMIEVKINNNRRALFCKMDRVCLPIAI